MKTLLLITIFLITFKSFGQLPEYTSNVDDTLANKSHLFQKFGKNYKLVVGYTQNSFWNKRQNYSVLTYNGSTWRFTEWSYQLNKKKSPIKQKLKSFNLDVKEATGFLDFINSRGFFSFNQDSLNLNKKNVGNGNTLVRQILDGTTYQFEVFGPSGYRISFAHEPERLQEFIATEQRKNFIDCRNRFTELSNNFR